MLLLKSSEYKLDGWKDGYWKLTSSNSKFADEVRFVSTLKYIDESDGSISLLDTQGKRHLLAYASRLTSRA